jgi:flagellin
MAQVINTNTMSLNAQRNLSTSGASLATTIQRLSSGLRINSAKDDAAGLAISERFSTQIRGLDVAVRNANDGISLAQVAEGSLTEIGNNLQNAEVKQLTAEIDRVAKQSEFNGTKLLDGSFSSQLFQVGANAGQAIAIDKTVDAKANALGGAMFATATFTTATPADGVTALKIEGLALTNADGATVTIDTVDVAAQGSAAATRDAAAKALVTAINAKVGETGVLAELGNTGAVNLTSVKDSVGTNGAFKGIAIETGTWTGGTAPADVAASTTATTKQFASNLDISSVKGAQQALEIVDKALTAVNSSRADLGAVQNRFTSVVANLQTSSENLAASRSRIRDTDFAKETAELTRTQILQQAGTAMLAQANQVPQNVMSLLR